MRAQDENGVKDLTGEALETITVDNQDFFRIPLDDRSVLVSAKCPHNGTPMSEAYLAGDFLVCRRHGATFDIRTGQWVRGPACGNLTIRRVAALDSESALGRDHER